MLQAAGAQPPATAEGEAAPTKRGREDHTESGKADKLAKLAEVAQGEETNDEEEPLTQGESNQEEGKRAREEEASEEQARQSKAAKTETVASIIEVPQSHQPAPKRSSADTSEASTGPRPRSASRPEGTGLSTPPSTRTSPL